MRRCLELLTHERRHFTPGRSGDGRDRHDGLRCDLNGKLFGVLVSPQSVACRKSGWNEKKRKLTKPVVSKNSDGNFTVKLAIKQNDFRAKSQSIEAA